MIGIKKKISPQQDNLVCLVCTHGPVHNVGILTHAHTVHTPHTTHTRIWPCDPCEGYVPMTNACVRHAQNTRSTHAHTYTHKKAIQGFLILGSWFVVSVV